MNQNIDVKIIADSITENEDRITTFQLRYPRIIHSELMTHRVFSRSAASNRAIPTNKLIESIDNNLILPFKYLTNIPGMQGGEELNEENISECKYLITKHWKDTKLLVEKLHEYKLHKQNCNRYLEPFQCIDVVVTSTEWDNFFKLRTDDKTVQPEMYELATIMKETIHKSIPTVIIHNYHTPYSNISSKEQSVARCARVSYLKHDNTESSLVEDKLLHDNLLEHKHMSPFEHVARPLTQYEKEVANKVNSIYLKYNLNNILNNPFCVANFTGWVSYRREIESRDF